MSGIILFANRSSGDNASSADVNQLLENFRAGAFPYYTAGATIAKYDIVTSDGLVANSATAAHRKKILGMAFEARTSSQQGKAQLIGEIDNPAWTWTPNDPVYLNGTSLSQTAPTSGFILQVGIAVSATRIVLGFIISQVGADTSISVTTGTTVNINAGSAKRYYITPTADLDVVLADDFDLNDLRYICNESTQYVITLKANDASEICKIIPKSWLWIRPNTALPADSTEWTQTDAGGEWIAWTPAPVNYGTTSAEMGYVRRNKGNIEGRASFVVGSGAALEGQVPIPFGLQSSSNILTVEPCGYVFGGNTYLTGDFRDTAVTIKPSVNYTTFGFNGSGLDVTNTLQGGDFPSGGNPIYSFSFPIDGWSLG